MSEALLKKIPEGAIRIEENPMPTGKRSQKYRKWPFQ
jgi:hypothetical protein